MNHEDYFKKHNLSVEQYGEILVKIAFRGEKMPDNYKGYDIKARIGSKPAKIEVKSKRADSPNSRATVVHCGENKFGHDGMTHLVVILVERQKDKPSVAEAWLLSRKTAYKLRRENTESKYINVGDLRRPAKKISAVKNIKTLLQKAAESFA